MKSGYVLHCEVHLTLDLDQSRTTVWQGLVQPKCHDGSRAWLPSPGTVRLPPRNLQSHA